ncbi:hypothetical protein KKA09_03135 [Patescibacteria group bacterium]|nr:hypothetical protein [Patescibacteria group bacterium]
MFQEPIQKENLSDTSDLISSEDIALILSAICVSSGIEQEEEIEKVSYQVARVLFNDLPSELLAKSLNENEGFSLEIAETIAQKADRYIFSQIEKSVSNEESAVPDEEPFSEKSEIIESPMAENPLTKNPPKDDVYREPIE